MCCREIVEHAFRDLVSRGEPETFARDAAIAIYRFHHPGVPEQEAADTVDMWTRPTLLN